MAPRYKTTDAVKDLNLNIKKGRIVGFVGPNGAGKSTIVKMLAGVLQPSQGVIRIAGRDPFKDRRAHHRSLGVVLGQRSRLQWDLPVQDSFSYHAAIYQLTPSQAAARVDELSNLFGLRDLMSQPVRTLSLGQRMRCDIALSMFHNPSLLLLDEPTIGLDFEVKETLRQSIQQVVERSSTTVLLTSHDLRDLEILCHEIVLISSGTLLFQGSAESLRTKLNARPSVFIRTEAASQLVQKWLDHLPYELDVAEDNGGLRVTYSALEAPAAVLQEVAQRTTLIEFSLKEPTIEEVVRATYRLKHGAH